VSASTDIAERHAVACDLFADAIHQFGSQQLKAGGNSMRPTIWPGDELLIQSVDPSDIAIGDVVAFRCRSAIVAHRVVAQVDLSCSVHLVTRGDRLRANDEPTSADALLGRVTRIRRGPFQFNPTRPVPFGWRATSALFEVALACRRLFSFARRRAQTFESWALMRAS
jgi:hypothetical protein